MDSMDVSWDVGRFVDDVGLARMSTLASRFRPFSLEATARHAASLQKKILEANGERYSEMLRLTEAYAAIPEAFRVQDRSPQGTFWRRRDSLRVLQFPLERILQMHFDTGTIIDRWFELLRVGDALQRENQVVVVAVKSRCGYNQVIWTHERDIDMVYPDLRVLVQK